MTITSIDIVSMNRQLSLLEVSLIPCEIRDMGMSFLYRPDAFFSPVINFNSETAS